MSQQSLEVQRLEALLRQRQEETRNIEDQLNRARRSSVLSASLELDPALADYHVAASRPSLIDHGRSRSNTIPRGAVGAASVVNLALKVEQGHSQQVSVTATRKLAFGPLAHSSNPQEQSRPMKKSKTTHHEATPILTGKMARSASNTASLATARTNSLLSRGAVLTPLHPSVAHNSYTKSEMLHDYLAQDQFQQPVNAFIQAESLYQEQLLNLPAEPLSKEMGIEEFLSMRDDDDVHTTAPMRIPTGSLLSPESAHFATNVGIPSACGSMTSGPTIETAPMTRSNSTMDNISISGQFHEMVRIRSEQSSRGHSRQDSFGHSLLGKRSMVEADLVAMGSNLSDLPNAYGSSAPPNFEHQHFMEKSVSQTSTRSSTSSGDGVGTELNSQALAQHLSMERSESNTSVRSNRSLTNRAKVVLSRQNINASRNIKPKPAADVIKAESVETTPAKTKDPKPVITKAKYERPKHPKVKCLQCNENPEGFRGEHELRRHTEAKHKSTVKKWICRDPAEEGIAHSETAIKPLRDCKQCSQKKQYGAYYNAAAHLRRTHFKVRPTRKGAGGKNGAKGPKLDDEKRGGKGGGDWPSMAELKLWMVEVSVHMDQAGALVPDGVDSVGAVDQEDLDNELLDPMVYGSHPELGRDGYDMSTAFAGVGGGFPQDFDVDASYQTLQGELGPQNPELYIDTSSFAPHGLPISSSGFDLNPSSANSTHHMASSMMSLDSHSYTSPVSSTATITQAGVFGDHMLAHPTLQLARDDLADMSFDLTFGTGGQ